MINIFALYSPKACPDHVYLCMYIYIYIIYIYICVCVCVCVYVCVCVCLLMCTRISYQQVCLSVIKSEQSPLVTVT